MACLTKDLYEPPHDKTNKMACAPSVGFVMRQLNYDFPCLFQAYLMAFLLMES